MTREDEAYLSGWAHAARCMDIHKRDYTGPLSARGAVTGAVHRPFVSEPAASFQNGADDGALAAFGHSDTDGANVGAPTDCPFDHFVDTGAVRCSYCGLPVYRA